MDLKILYLRTLFQFNLKAGGSVAHTAGVISELDKLVSLKVVSNDTLYSVKKEYEIVKPQTFYFVPNHLNELIYNYKIIKELKSKIINFNAIYQRYSGDSFAGAYLSKKNSIPLILEFNSSDVWKLKHWSANENIIKKTLRYFYNLYRIPLISFIENYNLSSASIIVVVSRVLKDNLVRLGVEPSKIIVNPNGIDPSIYSPSIDGKDIRLRYKMDDKLVIGFIGTFGKWHGAEFLTLAFGKMLKKYPKYLSKVILFMVGDGVMMPIVKDNIKKDNIESSCILTGLVAQEEGPKYLAACDILASPHVPNPDGTAFFGSPTKLFEYMAMGKGIVASDLEQIGEILKHNQTAYMVEPGDVDGLVEGLKALIEDFELRKKLGENARVEAVEKYTWKEHARKIV